MLSYLWKHRERPAVASRRWMIVWVKRMLQFPALVAIGMNRLGYARRGVTFGHLSILDNFEINGRAANLSIGHSTVIVRSVHIATHAPVSIGSNVSINARVTILSASHDVLDPEWRMTMGPITICDYVWIATGATVLPGVTLGYGCVVGAGAVVTKDVPPFAIARGNPASVQLDRRSTHLTYVPVLFYAPYEAWIGRNIATKQV